MSPYGRAGAAIWVEVEQSPEIVAAREKYERAMQRLREEQAAADERATPWNPYPAPPDGALVPPGAS